MNKILKFILGKSIRKEYGHRCKWCKCTTSNDNFLVCNAGRCHDGECREYRIYKPNE